MEKKKEQMMEQKRKTTQFRNDDEMQIDLVEFAYYLKSKIWMILAVFIVGAVLAGAYTHYCVTPMYKATAKVYLVSASGAKIELSDLSLGDSLSEDYKELIQLRPVYNEVIDDLGLDYDYKALGGMVNVSYINSTRLMAITVQSADPEEAKNIANTLAEKAVTYLPKVMDTSVPKIAEEEILPAAPSSPSLSGNIMKGGLIAMVLMLAVFTLFFLMDDSVKSGEDIEKLIGALPLTSIPDGSKLGGKKTKKKGKK